jgi:hypothetical protein
METTPHQQQPYWRMGHLTSDLTPKWRVLIGAHTWRVSFIWNHQGDFAYPFQSSLWSPNHVQCHGLLLRAQCWLSCHLFICHQCGRWVNRISHDGRLRQSGGFVFSTFLFKYGQGCWARMEGSLPWMQRLHTTSLGFPPFPPAACMQRREGKEVPEKKGDKIACPSYTRGATSNGNP